MFIGGNIDAVEENSSATEITTASQQQISNDELTSDPNSAIDGCSDPLSTLASAAVNTATIQQNAEEPTSISAPEDGPKEGWTDIQQQANNSAGDTNSMDDGCSDLLSTLASAAVNTARSSQNDVSNLPGLTITTRPPTEINLPSNLMESVAIPPPQEEGKEVWSEAVYALKQQVSNDHVTGDVNSMDDECSDLLSTLASAAVNTARSSQNDVSNQSALTTPTNPPEIQVPVAVQNPTIQQQNVIKSVVPIVPPEDDRKERWVDVAYTKYTVFQVKQYFNVNEKLCNLVPDADVSRDLEFIKKRLELSPGTAYKFRVAAMNACGRGPWSEVKSLFSCSVC